MTTETFSTNDGMDADTAAIGMNTESVDVGFDDPGIEKELGETCDFDDYKNSASNESDAATVQGGNGGSTENEAPATASVKVDQSIDSSRATAAHADVLIENIQYETEILKRIPEELNADKFNAIEAILNISESDYTSETLDRCINVTNTFAKVSETVGNSAVAVATLFKIREGKNISKTHDVYKIVHGKGWDKAADKLFHYPRSTRYSLVALYHTNGVKECPFLGSERLKSVPKALKKLGIDKEACENHIAAIFEACDKKYDLNRSHSELMVDFDDVIKMVNSPKSDETAADGDAAAAAAKNIDGNTSTSAGTDESGDDRKTDSGDVDTDDTGKNSETGAEGSKSTGDDEKSTSSNTTDESDQKGTDSGEPEDEETEEEAELRKLMNHDHLNRQCAKVITTSEKIINLKLPKDKFETYILEEAITCFLQSKNPHFCKQKSSVEGGEFLTI